MFVLWHGDVTGLGSGELQIWLIPKIYVSRDSELGIVTGYGLDD
jgi:hypothetical protein